MDEGAASGAPSVSRGRARQATPLHITLRCGRKLDELSSHFDIAPADAG